jgi:transposase
MLQITPQQIILLAVQPVDFRKGIESLAAICQSELQEDPFSGKLFVFTNRSRRAVKVIVYDGGGFWLCLKRFSQGRLAWWPQAGDRYCKVLASELQILLYQGCPQQARFSPQWRPLHPSKPPGLPVGGSVYNSKATISQGP